MNKSLMKKNPILKIINSSLISLPTPSNISIWWNFGSLLGLCLIIQILTGLFLSMHYCPNINYAFNSIIHIMQDVNYGWILRYLHMNGASMFFICIYLHIGRGIYYHSFKLMHTWMVGVIILFLTMATAFMGYVLPWGQMSFWGATVITNLMSAIPYVGDLIVKWLWGGFSINNATLNRFYSIHFILPFIILAMMIIHLTYLHETGSNNPLGVNSNYYMIPFHSYFTIKDIVGFLILMFSITFIVVQSPNMLGDPDNFTPANPMVTPEHIQPEWYFLFAYAILRSIPNKLGGVIALVMSILILMIMPFFTPMMMNSIKFYPINQIYFWLFTSSIIILTWTGAQPIEYPYTEISQITAIFYFSFYLINPIIMNYWDNMLIKNIY